MRPGNAARGRLSWANLEQLLSPSTPRTHRPRPNTRMEDPDVLISSAVLGRVEHSIRTALGELKEACPHQSCSTRGRIAGLLYHHSSELLSLQCSIPAAAGIAAMTQRRLPLDLAVVEVRLKRTSTLLNPHSYRVSCDGPRIAARVQVGPRTADVGNEQSTQLCCDPEGQYSGPMKQPTRSTKVKRSLPAR